MPLTNSKTLRQCNLINLLLRFRQQRRFNPFKIMLTAFLIFFAFHIPAQAQNEKTNNKLEPEVPSKTEIVGTFKFVEHKIEKGDEDIHYYIYNGEKVEKTGLVLYIQGSDPSPQFCYKKVDGKFRPWGFVKPDFRNIPKEFVYVVVEKPGLAGLFDADNIEVPKLYSEKNSLDNSVFRINSVIDELAGKHRFNRVIVYGHSEGAPIGAKLATINKHITHLGFWAGNALPDFFDFVIEERIRVHKGETTAAESQRSIDETISKFQEISQNRDDTSAPDSTTQLQENSQAEIHSNTSMVCPSSEGT